MTFGPLVVAERSIVPDGKGAKEYVDAHKPVGNCEICGLSLSWFYYNNAYHAPVLKKYHWNCHFALYLMRDELKQELIKTAEMSSPSYYVRAEDATLTRYEKIPKRMREEHGVVRRDPALYRRLTQLSMLNMVWRRGYRYAPTHQGWRVYIRMQPHKSMYQAGESWETIFKGALQKHF